MSACVGWLVGEGKLCVCVCGVCVCVVGRGLVRLRLRLEFFGISSLHFALSSSIGTKSSTQLYRGGGGEVDEQVVPVVLLML